MKRAICFEPPADLNVCTCKDEIKGHAGTQESTKEPGKVSGTCHRVHVHTCNWTCACNSGTAGDSKLRSEVNYYN